MLKFKKVEVKDLKIIQKYTKNSPYKLCDYSCGVVLMWKEFLNHEYAIFNNTLILKTGETNPRFFAPLGEDIKGAYDEIERYCIENELNLSYVCIEEENLEFFIERYKEKASFAYNRDYSDYLYSFDEIKTFQGKKFSGQRNHINGFKKNYPNYEYKKITRKVLPKLINFLNEYKTQHKNMDKIEKSEFLNTKVLLNNFFKFDFVGGYIEVDKKIVSMSIGEYVGETLIIHVEKALVEYKGVYPTTFNEFVKNNQKDGVIYINREDDAGDLGLRTSKTQYKPIKLANKYKIKIEKPMPKIKIPKIKGERVVLDKITKKDSENYFKLYTQKTNNRYWGYNYKKHLKKVEKDTFYNMQRKDYLKRNNMCLAIRKKESKTLIGEVVLHNFDYKSSVEIGIRLFKREQNKGYATESLNLIKSYVEKELKKEGVAKCYKNNFASKKLFENNGFYVYKESKKYYHFALKK